jgi:hypothetical protein
VASGDPETEEAVARACRKLDELRGGTAVPRPAGRNWLRTSGGIAVILFGLAMLAGCWVILASRDVQTAAVIVLSLIFAVPALLCLLYGLRLILTSKPDSPELAAALFFWSVARGRYGYARRIVVPNDFDDFPRDYPAHPSLGLGGVPPFAFDGPDDFRSYWNGLLRYHTAPYCLAKVRDVQHEEVAPDLAIVEWDLTLTMNTQLWLLFILLGCPGMIAAFIVDAATRKRVTTRMRKIAYRAGDEWHLLNGAWQGKEEEDVSWLGA